MIFVLLQYPKGKLDPCWVREYREGCPVYESEGSRGSRSNTVELSSFLSYLFDEKSFEERSLPVADD